MSATAIPLTAAMPWSAKWIINRREDLTWFIGSGLVGYLAIALMAAGFPVTPLYIFWMFGVDGPHVIATVTRTYCDKNERGRLGWWLWVLVPFLMIGPAFVIAGYASLFYLATICWQHVHVAKQHFGFMMLYKAKNGDRDPADFRVDRYYLLTSLFMPLVWFVIATREFSGTPILKDAFGIAAVIYLGTTCYFIKRQIDRHRSGRTLNLPKMLLLAVVIPLQWLAFTYAAQFGPDGVIRAGIPLGMFHSFQYHRLLWFHNKNRYTSTQDPKAQDAKEKYGFAATLAKGGLGVYLLVAIGLNLLIAYIPVILGLPLEIMKASVWGFAFTHYVLDARIWRVRGDKDLAAALHF